MQYELDLNLFRGNHEADARAWSISLFRTVAPESYKNAIEKRLLRFN